MRMESICFWVIVIVVTTSLVLIPSAESSELELEYSCNPSGTITVLNPNKTLYVDAHAQTEDGTQNCTVLLSSFFGIIVISNCPISTNISLWLLESEGLPVVLTDAIEFHTIRCQQIPATGVMRKVTDDSWVTNYISTSVEPSVTPVIILSTQLEDIESGVKRETAIVGEPLLWEIDGPEGYTVLPLNCTVESGVGDAELNLVLNGSVNRKLSIPVAMVTNCDVIQYLQWCSLDTYLLEHFEYLSETQTNILVAELYAFRFASSTQIVILCDMLGCHNNSNACDFTCPSEKRRRRDNSDSNMKDIVREQSYSSQSEYKNKRADNMHGNQKRDDPQLRGQVSVRLTILDPYAVDIEKNGSQDLISIASVLTMCISTVMSSILESLD